MQIYACSAGFWGHGQELTADTMIMTSNAIENIDDNRNDTNETGSMEVLLRVFGCAPKAQRCARRFACLRPLRYFFDLRP